MMAQERYQKWLRGETLPLSDERALLDAVARSDPGMLPHVCGLLVNQKQRLREELAAAEKARCEAQAALAEMRRGPWYPADVVRIHPDGRIEVAAGGRRQVVTVAPEVDRERIRVGDEILLDAHEAVALANGAAQPPGGTVGTVAEVTGGRVVVRGTGDDETVTVCNPELAAALRPGDRVLYRRDSQVLLERLGEHAESPFALEQPPAVTFDDIGGLDDVIAQVRRDLDIHLLHPELVARYQLQLMRGMTFVGPPGVGKTLLAGAIANYLLRTSPTTRFLYVPPGALRGIFYGQTEMRIRNLFATARRAPGPVVIYFDELDSFGARGAGIAQTVDDRVMGTLLDEINGLSAHGRFLCLGATNRLDLCDDALVRPGRLGDRIYKIPRPDRKAAREIFARHLQSGLPYTAPGGEEQTRQALIDAAVAYLYAPRGDAGAVGTLTLATGERESVPASALVSGALIASAVQQAKHAAAARHLAGDGGLTVEDLLDAIDEALAAEAEKLRTPRVARRLLDAPHAEDIVRVELARHGPRRHRYLRAL